MGLYLKLLNGVPIFLIPDSTYFQYLFWGKEHWSLPNETAYSLDLLEYA